MPKWFWSSIMKGYPLMVGKAYAGKPDDMQWIRHQHHISDFPTCALWESYFCILGSPNNRVLSEVPMSQSRKCFFIQQLHVDIQLWLFFDMHSNESTDQLSFRL